MDGDCNAAAKEMTCAEETPVPCEIPVTSSDEQPARRHVNPPSHGRVRSNGSVRCADELAPTATPLVTSSRKEQMHSQAPPSSKPKPLKRGIAVTSGPSHGEWGDCDVVVDEPMLARGVDLPTDKSRMQENVPLQRASSEDSSLAKNPSKVDLHAFIVKTLKEKPKDRLPVLKLERDFTNLINDTTSKGVLTYEGMSSYYRMLVHRIAAYFELEHNVDSSEKCVVVSKTNLSQIPEQSFQLYCSREYSDEELTSLPKSILRRSNTVSSDDTPVSSRPGSPNSVACRRTSMKDKKSKSLEEREDDYLKAKARIFNQDSLSSQSSGEEKEASSPSVTAQLESLARQGAWAARYQSQDAQLAAQKKGQLSSPTVTPFPNIDSGAVPTQYPVEYVYVDQSQDSYGGFSPLSKQDLYLMAYQQQLQQQQQQHQLAQQLFHQSMQGMHTGGHVRSDDGSLTGPTAQGFQQSQQQQLYEETMYNQAMYGGSDPNIQRVFFLPQGQQQQAAECQEYTAPNTAPLQSQYQDVTGQLAALNLTGPTTLDPNQDTTGRAAADGGPQSRKLSLPSQHPQLQQEQQQRHAQSVLLATLQQQQQRQHQPPQQYVVVQQPPSGPQSPRSPGVPIQYVAQGPQLGQMMSSPPYGTSYVQIDPASMRYPYQATAFMAQRPASPILMGPTYGVSSASPGPPSPFERTPPPQPTASPPQMMQGPLPGSMARSGSTIQPGMQVNPQGMTLGSSTMTVVGGGSLDMVGSMSGKQPAAEKSPYQVQRQPADISAFHCPINVNPNYGVLMQPAPSIPLNMAQMGGQPRPYFTMVPMHQSHPGYPIQRRPYPGSVFHGYRPMMAYHHPGMMPIGNPVVHLPHHRKSKTKRGHSRYSSSHGHGRRDRDHASVGHILEAYDFAEGVAPDDVDVLLAGLRDIGAHISKVAKTTQATGLPEDGAPALPAILVMFNTSDKAQHALRNFHHPKYKLRMYRKTGDSRLAAGAVPLPSRGATSSTAITTATTATGTTSTATTEEHSSDRIHPTQQHELISISPPPPNDSTSTHLPQDNAPAGQKDSTRDSSIQSNNNNSCHNTPVAAHVPLDATTTTATPTTQYTPIA